MSLVYCFFAPLDNHSFERIFSAPLKSIKNSNTVKFSNPHKILNIFFLDYNPSTAATYYVDRHVVKIITEINQMLASAYDFAPYKKSYINHPMTKWCRESLNNFNWAVLHCAALCKEYTHRYNKIHKGEGILEWYRKNSPKIEKIEFTEPPQCLSIFREQCYVDKNPIKGYHNYYNAAKRHLFKWTKREIPYFVNL